MPKIDLCFQGWMRGVEIEQAFDATGENPVDVSKLSAEQLVAAIKTGDVTLSLKDTLALGADDDEIEMFDFEASK